MEKRPSSRISFVIQNNENTNKSTLPDLLEVQKQQITNVLKKNCELAQKIENKEALKTIMDEFQKQTNINLNRPSLTKKTINDLLQAQISENIEKAQNASVLISLFKTKSNEATDTGQNKNLPTTTSKIYDEQLQRDEKEIKRLLQQTTLSEEDEKKIQEMTATYDRQRTELTQKFKRLKDEFVNKMSVLHLKSVKEEKKQ